MAIPFSLPDIGRRILPEETGTPNYIAALKQGMELGYMPGEKRRAAYAKELANKINEAKAHYAMQQALADLQYTRAGTSNLGAEAELHHGQAGLLPFEKQLRIAQAQQAAANAKKAEFLGNIYDRYLHGNSGSTGQAQTERGAPTTYAEQLLNPQLQTSNAQQERPSADGNIGQPGNVNDANLIAAINHWPVNSQVVNGQLITNNPLTGISSTKVGPSAEESAFASGMGKYGAELYKDVTNSYRGLQNQGLALQELTHSLSNSEFRNVTGKINAPLAHWLGTPEQQQLLGTLQSASGEIALQVAPALKGAFTGRDQTLINSIKANPKTDFADEFIGKLKAQTLINSVLEERSRLTAENIENGIKPFKALQLATQQTPLEKFRPQVEKMIKHIPKLNAAELLQAKIELSRRQGRK